VYEGKEEAGEERDWNECLLAILKAILRVESLPVAQRQMEKMVASGFDGCTRGGATELEFATEVEKVLKFSMWHAKVLAQGKPIGDIIDRYHITAYQTFTKGLRQMERIGWNWIDEEDTRPLAKVLSKLRNQSSVGVSVVPAMPVKAGPLRKSGNQGTAGPKGREFSQEEDEEEEGELEIAPPTKKRTVQSRPIQQPVAIVETEEGGVIAAIRQLLGEKGRNNFQTHTNNQQNASNSNNFTQYNQSNNQNNNHNNNFTHNNNQNNQYETTNFTRESDNDNNSQNNFQNNFNQS